MLTIPTDFVYWMITKYWSAVNTDLIEKLSVFTMITEYLELSSVQSVLAKYCIRKDGRCHVDMKKKSVEDSGEKVFE